MSYLLSTTVQRITAEIQTTIDIKIKQLKSQQWTKTKCNIPVGTKNKLSNYCGVTPLNNKKWSLPLL